jgi:predicted phosphodiesterase
MAERPVSRVGLISDTHGHLRPEVFAALEGVERVLHAGDVENPDHLTDLSVHQVHPEYRLLIARFPDARVIVHGHTHVPRCDMVGDVLLVNPGAAGNAQKGHAPSVAILEVGDGRPTVRHVNLEAPAD